ncbi:hypothetical protein GCM10009821_28360 [Aeromicrobium halocynthiae]|uniref:MFS transporter n=1 Tax=Aeromicrobium halocynthiae TaxID=560557 RepID=A0ABN2W6N9_9ACTN
MAAGVFGVGFVVQLGILASSFVTSADPAGRAASIVFLARTVVGAVTYAILLAAAVTRRLHDRGHRGRWALYRWRCRSRASAS